MPDNKSFADVVSEAVHGSIYRLVGVLLGAGLIVFALIYSILHTLPSKTRAASLEAGSFKFGVILSQPVDGGSAYAVMISPQGWQRTSIYVRRGQRLSIDAGGRVYIDLMSLNAGLAERWKAEKRVIHELERQGKWDKEKLVHGAEHYYKPRERRAITEAFKWGWTGPAGFDEATMFRLATPARRSRAIKPSAGYGTLLAALVGANTLPQPEDVFVVATRYDDVAPRDGCLYFAVNDVLNDPADQDLPPDMFLQDNIGFFYANVTLVSPKGVDDKDNEGAPNPCR